MRQQTGFAFGQNVPIGEIAPTPQQMRLVNAVMATVSIPLGSGPRSPTVSGGVTNTADQGATYQASLSGIADQTRTLNYGLSVSRETQNGATNFSANVQKSLPVITVGANYSNGTNFWQAGANARGAAVAHAGGVTFGQYLGMVPHQRQRQCQPHRRRRASNDMRDAWRTRTSQPTKPAAIGSVSP